MRDAHGTGPHYGEIVSLGVDICVDVPCVEVHVKADGYCMGALRLSREDVYKLVALLMERSWQVEQPDMIEDLRSARRGHEHQSD